MTELNHWPVLLDPDEHLEVKVTPAGLELLVNGERLALLDTLELRRVLSNARSAFSVTAIVDPPRPARDVPVGESWAFKDHRTVAEWDRDHPETP